MGEEQRRAIGIVRVSQVRGRAGDSFASPREQADRIRAACEREHLTLLRIHEELDVSGGRDLDDRPGLGPAVHAIETGQADVIVGAYFDRLFRSIKAQSEAVERVERAGGHVLAVDTGRVTNRTAGQWLSGSMLGLVSEYQRRTTAERTREAQADAIRRGAPPYGRVTAGYQRAPDGTFLPDPVKAPVVAEGFRLRAHGATVDHVWRHLQEHGIQITYGGAYALLHSRVVLGELHFGGFTPNLNAHPAIVDRSTWEAVQRIRVPGGRRTKSDRLLARLGVLLCGTCGSRLSASTATGAGGQTYPIYRCVNKACGQPVAISSHRAESAVTDRVRAFLADLTGRASAASNMTDAAVRLERAQADLDAAIRTLAVVSDEPAAVERLTGLRGARDAAQAEVDRLSGLEVALRINVGEDWDRLTLEERRALIRANVRSARVRPGRGNDRVVVELFGEQASSSSVQDPL